MPKYAFLFFLSLVLLGSLLSLTLSLCLCPWHGLCNLSDPSLPLASSSLSPSNELELPSLDPEPVFSLQPYHMMTRWALVVFMVLMLDRILFVPGTPISTFQLHPQNYPETTPSSVIPESPSGTTTGSSVSWSNSKASPYLDTRVILSLDVPIGLLRILLEQARNKAARNQAATNAQILAHVGRR